MPQQNSPANLPVASTSLRDLHTEPSTAVAWKSLALAQLCMRGDIDRMGFARYGCRAILHQAGTLMNSNAQVQAPQQGLRCSSPWWHRLLPAPHQFRGRCRTLPCSNAVHSRCRLPLPRKRCPPAPPPAGGTALWGRPGPGEGEEGVRGDGQVGRPCRCLHWCNGRVPGRCAGRCEGSPAGLWPRASATPSPAPWPGSGSLPAPPHRCLQGVGGVVGLCCKPNPTCRAACTATLWPSHPAQRASPCWARCACHQNPTPPPAGARGPG